jgi:FtsP/CotA-like multicopper oxidase with cupredoxin domain
MRPARSFVFLLLIGCSTATKENAFDQPTHWDEQIAPPLAEDLDPDPQVLELRIEARLQNIEVKSGVPTEMWTYNGTVPGPLIRANRGDRLTVHFTNHLPEATSIHWHGVRVPADMDGTHAVQDPVQPGDSFTYSFILPDAGTYWYHPHVNSSAQVGYGLYGPIVVDDPDDPVSADDLVLVLSDVSLEADGQLTPGDQNGWFGDYFGREGPLLLVNGKILPSLKMRAGVPQRWRIINAARSRFFEVAVPGVAFWRIGGDGGLIERPQEQASLFLAPSERGELIVTPPKSSVGTGHLVNQDPDRYGIGQTYQDEPLVEVEVLEANGASPPELPDQLRGFPEYDLTELPARQIELGEALIDGVAHMSINGEVHSDSSHEGSHAHVAYVGDTEIWEVLNATDFAHPFHLHGFAFEILDLGGKTWPVREWKDSVNVPAKQVLRFVVTYDDRPGQWMFHCHILDHAQLGMMAVLDVRPRQEKPPSHDTGDH